MPKQIETEAEAVAQEVVQWFRHIETGIVGFFRSSGPDTEGQHVTAIQTGDDEILNKPTAEFEPIESRPAA